MAPKRHTKGGDEAPKKKQKIRSGHPGVVLKKRVNPSGTVVWRARYKDPESGGIKYVTLEDDLTTAEARRKWAIKKSESLSTRRTAIRGGAARMQKAKLGTALDEYLKAAAHERRAGTMTTYTAGVNLLKQWAEQARIRSTTELNTATLRGFRKWLAARPKRVNATGEGSRKQRVDSAERLSPATVNMYLRSVKAALNDLRADGPLAHLSKDDIKDALKRADEANRQIDYLTGAQCVRLIREALKHDAAKHTLTRKEKLGKAKPGTTPKYTPITALICVTLLSGMRATEAFALEHASLDLDAPDDHGNPVGEIRLSAEQTKTKTERAIGLEVSPALRAILKLLHDRRGNREYVFGGAQPLSRMLAESSRKRLIDDYDAPEWTWQMLRRTAGTHLVNAPAIYGAASVFLAAKQLGHGIEVAQAYYLGRVRGISPNARTLEAALGIEAVLDEVIVSLNGEPLTKRDN